VYPSLDGLRLVEDGIQGRVSIFMFHCEPKAHVDSRESGNPDAVPVKTGNQNTKELDARLKTSGMTEKNTGFLVSMRVFAESSSDKHGMTEFK
jgi:hypothetical protein